MLLITGFPICLCPHLLFKNLETTSFRSLAYKRNMKQDTQVLDNIASKFDMKNRIKFWIATNYRTHIVTIFAHLLPQLGAVYL